MAQISNAKKLFEYKLGIALGLERKVLAMLAKMEKQARLAELKQGFARHRQETEGQIRNIEQAMQAIGGSTTAHQDPIMEGIAQHAEQMLGRVDEQLADSILAGGAAETEHHEIAIYEGLISMANAIEAEDVVALLEENLEEEQRTLQEVERLTNELAQQLATISA
jgi:ferritin-like metal-binding protein YciE